MKSHFDPCELNGLKATVMGLGLHGGGLESCRFLLKHGAQLTITDLRDEKTLAPSLEALAGHNFRLVCGRHEDLDFSNADLVIKNPAVRPGNKYLALAQRIETDLSFFFASVKNPILAITGTKGKSTCASALFFCLKSVFPDSQLGGNITVSPLSFLDKLEADAPVVLELSSFQLGDLVETGLYKEGRLRSFPPRLAIMTRIFNDHLDYYGTMEPYLKDKAQIFLGQSKEQDCLFFAEDEKTTHFASQSSGRVHMLALQGAKSGSEFWLEEFTPSEGELFSGPRGYYKNHDLLEELVPRTCKILGLHHRQNLLAAAAAARIFGLSSEKINKVMSEFPGVEHRLETVCVIHGRTFVNDSAATIPDAALAAVQSFGTGIHLITGGTDKALEFSIYLTLHEHCSSMRLLKGSASDAISKTLQAAGKNFEGIYDNLELCVHDAFMQSKEGDIIILSPGCASFGLFLNEFDRGSQFKAVVEKLSQSFS